MTSYPKDTAQRNPHLLAMARDKPCLLRVNWICNRDPATTVAAHSNFSQHSKGKARKAHDFYTVWACSECHAWLDSGGAFKSEKYAAFIAAHREQIAEWRAIAASHVGNDQKAAQWALEMLAARPLFQGRRRLR